MAIVESESDLMMGWLMIRTFYNSPSIPDYSGKADALIRLKRAMRKFMHEQPPCREWIVKDYYDGSCIQLEQLPDELDSYTEDEVQEWFMEELFPDGCTIGEQELNKLTDRAIQFLKTDTICLDIKAGHDKARFTFWVYFIPEHKVYPCQFAQHEETVMDILVDFFGVNVLKYSVDALQKFILGAFQIQSTNTSVRSIAADAEFIQRTVYYRADGLRKARA